MALIQLGAFITQLSGKIGGQSISNRGNSTTIRNITQPSPSATVLQSFQRSLTSQISNSWQFLTQVQRDAWTATAVNYTYVNRVGQTITRNGYQTFCFCNQNLFLAGIPFIQNAPTYIPVTVPKYNVIDVSSGVFEIQSNNSTSAYLYAVFAQVNISQGATAQSSSMRFVGLITSAELLAGIDLVPMLESYFGTLTFPNKIGVIIDPINQTTGNRKQFVDIIENVSLPMIFEIFLSAAASVTIPFTVGGTFNGTVNFGDGTINSFTAWNSAGLTRAYASGGTKTIIIEGVFPRFQVASGAMTTQFSKLKQFGTNRFQALNFAGCLTADFSSVTDTPSFVATATLFRLFSTCSQSLVVNRLSEWDTSEVVNMSESFYNIKLVDIPVQLWNVSKVNTFSNMFYTCNNFVADITGWTFLNGANLSRMLFQCAKFNQNISVWNVSQIANFERTLYRCNLFNHSLAAWDIRNATNMSAMLETTLMSQANWNATLIAWNALVNPPAGIAITCKAVANGAGLVAKNNLVATWGWTITEGI